MSDVKDSLHHLGSFNSLSKLFSLLLLLSHELISILKSFNLSNHLVFHGVENLLLLEDCILSVKFLSFVIFGFSQLSVVNDDVSALIGSPSLV